MNRNHLEICLSSSGKNRNSLTWILVALTVSYLYIDSYKVSAVSLQSACREPDLSLAGLDPVPLSKIGTRLLASLGSKGKNRNPLACLRNAGSYSGMTYCIGKRKG